jgi:hypothetical protein
MFEFTKDIYKAFKCADFGKIQLGNISWDFIKETFPKYSAIVDLFIKYTGGSAYNQYSYFPLTDTLVNTALLFEKANNYDEYLLAFTLFIDKFVENTVRNQIKERIISKENKYIIENLYRSIILSEYSHIIEKICNEICEEEISIG